MDRRAFLKKLGLVGGSVIAARGLPMVKPSEVEPIKVTPKSDQFPPGWIRSADCTGGSVLSLPIAPGDYLKIDWEQS